MDKEKRDDAELKRLHGMWSPVYKSEHDALLGLEEHNDLTSLPLTLGNLKSLRDLVLLSNDVSSFSDDVKEMLESIKSNGCYVFKPID